MITVTNQEKTCIEVITKLHHIITLSHDNYTKRLNLWHNNYNLVREWSHLEHQCDLIDSKKYKKQQKEDGSKC